MKQRLFSAFDCRPTVFLSPLADSSGEVSFNTVNQVYFKGLGLLDLNVHHLSTNVVVRGSSGLPHIGYIDLAKFIQQSFVLLLSISKLGFARNENIETSTITELKKLCIGKF